MRAPSKSKNFVSTGGFVRQKARGRTNPELMRLNTRRTGRAWAIVRALVWWLALMQRVKRRNRAMQVVKLTLSQCGEWARLRFAMHWLVRAVRSLQHRARAFLRLKHQRMEIMQAQWQRFEDVNLESYCINFANDVLRDKYEDSSRRYLVSGAQDARSKNKAMHQKLKEGIVQLDWKKFRIPVSKRRAILSRYYMVTLKKHLRIQTSIVTMMRRVVQSQREMVGYLQQFGAELKSGLSLTSDDKAVQDVAPPPWWHLSEEVIVQFIALCAKDLKDGGVEPFQDHPAFISITGNVMYRSSMHEANMLLALVGSGRATHGPERKPTQKVAKKAVWARKLGQRADIEDVFGLFTPRLREITEKQSSEYRASSLTGTATPTQTAA